jgi:hypothetical protein
VVNSFFRHYAIRLWGTALLGAIIGMMLLPWWQRFWGVHWLIAPVTVMLAVIFIGIGWVMNRFGLLFLMRQLKEAAVYERAGLIPETRSAFEQAAALYDSFWLSPVKRKSENFRLSSRMARFYLSRPVLDAHCRLALAAHLKSFPHDEIVAESWLSRLRSIREIFPEEYDAAALVGEILQDLPEIQWGLFQFYLKDHRTDFNALKVYQRVWEQTPPLPEPVLSKLACLLLDSTMLNDWCLEIYLRAYKTSEPECLEGIAAAARWLPKTVDNASILVSARNLIADLPQDRLASLTRRFEKHGDIIGDRPAPGRKIARNRAVSADILHRSLAVIALLYRRTIIALSRSVQQFAMFWRRSGGFRKALVGGILCLLVVLGVVLVRPARNTAPEETGPLETPPAVEQLAPIITDPFTIQVAAYLNPDDAKGYVRILKDKGLDAYWTQATSASRVWYQVKVSHFPTKAQARQYGDRLKSKGLIDDFYVANYQQNASN